MSTPIPDEQAALLSAIIADPDADAPRLVYADWLQEHSDEEQAQFIRDSIQLEWLEDYEDDKRARLFRHIDGSAVRNGARWLDTLGVLRLADFVYDRGMVSGVIYDSFDSFRLDAPALFTRVPVRDLTVRTVTADPKPEPLLVLSRMPELSGLNALRISTDGWSPAGGFWTDFLMSPHLANLELLSLKDAGLWDQHMTIFDECRHLDRLEELGLSGNHLTAIGALTVVRSPRLPKLRRLGLAYNNIAEDRSRGSPWMTLRDELIDRFDSTSALDSVV